MFLSGDVKTSSVPLFPAAELFFFITYVAQTPVSSLGIRQTNSQPPKPAILLVNTSVGEGVP